MSWMKHHYHDEICGLTSGDYPSDNMQQQQDDWEQQQQADEGYEAISIDYSEKSWAQFSEDLRNPDSPILKQLAELCDVSVKDE